MLGYDVMPILEARQVCKYFKEGSPSEVRALEDVTLAVEAGSVTLLRGPSGSGKTTLLALLGALERPSRGQILFEERDLHGCSDVELARLRRRLGFVFQDYSLIPGLAVWDNITYPLIPRGIRRRERYQRARDLLGKLDLAARLDARPQELSGGEQQRVAVARALVGEPEVILADEPTSNLDMDASAKLMSMLQAIHGQGKTVVLSSHDPQWAPLASHVYELDRGRLHAR
jgi:putative ABC transport system ATP-binding protein